MATKLPVLVVPLICNELSVKTRPDIVLAELILPLTFKEPELITVNTPLVAKKLLVVILVVLVFVLIILAIVAVVDINYFHL